MSKYSSVQCNSWHHLYVRNFNPIRNEWAQIVELKFVINPWAVSFAHSCLSATPMLMYSKTEEFSAIKQSVIQLSWVKITALNHTLIFYQSLHLILSVTVRTFFHLFEHDCIQPVWETSLRFLFFVFYQHSSILGASNPFSIALRCSEALLPINSSQHFGSSLLLRRVNVLI